MLMFINAIGAITGNVITASNGDIAYTAIANATVPNVDAAKFAIVSMVCSLCVVTVYSKVYTDRMRLYT